MKLDQDSFFLGMTIGAFLGMLVLVFMQAKFSQPHDRRNHRVRRQK